MDRQLLKDGFGWGILIWMIGYVLGIILFAAVPPNLIGWILMPVGIAITVWVLATKIRGETWAYFVGLAVIWTVIAIVFDYLFLVKLFSPPDGYYKLDVYLYYALTFLLPLAAGAFHHMRRTKR